MRKTLMALLSLQMCWLSACHMNESSIREDLKVSRDDYQDKLKGFWLGSCIANWTGLQTENRKADFPFYTDADFGEGKIDFVLDQDPWKADDDTDIEYIYQMAIEKNGNYLLTGEQISEAWQRHIGLPALWVSNLCALGQMQNGELPPATSLPKNNPMWDMIDAQLTTEIFGALSPGRPDIGLKLAHLPIRTTAYLHSEWAAEFYVIMYALAATADTTLEPKDQIIRMADQARQRIPDWSYIADMYDFVRNAYMENPDKNNWEKTRDEVARRYQQEAAAGYEYKYPWDSGINYAASIISLLYGEGDYKKTIRIGTLCGWDSDNPTATWGGFLGLLYGHKALQEQFQPHPFSDKYHIARTRYHMPMEVDDFNAMSERGIQIIDRIVVEEMGGAIENDHWIIPPMSAEIKEVLVGKTEVPWVIIEDNDPRWNYDGFETTYNNWNASGAYLTRGYANCKAEFTFSGTAVQYYAYRSARGGMVTIMLDGENKGEYSLKSHASERGQYYVKIFEALDLPAGVHTIQIIGDSTTTEKTIDLLSIIP